MSDEKENIQYSVRVKIIIAVLITFVITFCFSIFVYDRYLSSKNLIVSEYESSGNIQEDLDLLRTTLESNYKGEINDKELYFSALKGYVEGLGDEYTVLMSDDEYDSLNSTLDDFTGIGIYLAEEKNTGRTIIISAINDETPAAQAGIKPGDIIIEVNLEDVSTKGVDYIASRIKGKEGTTVKVKVLRGEEEIVFDIERKTIQLYKLEYEMIENNIGYIDFDSFTGTCDEEFIEAINDLNSQGMKSLIIDLRDNTGGYVDSALNIADLFIEKGKTLLITEDKDGNEEKEVAAKDKTVDVPVIILVNEYSASASEILTGCLKDYNVATVVGTNTYGKGVIQSLVPNVLGEQIGGALKVTIAEYYTPNKNKINKIGIEPDEVVELELGDDETLTKDNDNQLKKAIEILNSK
ncbi:MAG: S41 family peptidase [Clostridia bacterium]|nr:S41 family peptidase [Clostridia bacterium]